MITPTLPLHRAIVLALGSNIGPGRLLLDAACAELAQCGVPVLRRSRIYHTRPWGVTDQPPFVNAAVAVATSAPPRALLAICLAVERTMGRRRFRKWGPRLIDIDLLLYRGVTLSVPNLTLPHPGILQRDFVLAPLLDLNVEGNSEWSAALAALDDRQRSILGSERWA